jgi:long-subunit fatty acid transport protein
MVLPEKERRSVFPVCRSRRVILFVLISAVMCASSVHGETLFQQVGVASSPNPVGSGARAVGMGGAFIAVADDATAASWNPSGLIQLERPEVSIVGGYLYSKESFSSDDHPEIDNTGDTSDFSVNYFSASYPFHLFTNMVASINYQRLYEFNRDFGHELDLSTPGLMLTQEKHYKQEGYLGALGFALAIQLHPRLSIGATLNVWTDKLLWQNGWDETFKERTSGMQGGVPVIIDTEIQDQYSDFHGVNANFGVLWSVTNWMAIGAVIKTPFDASINHEFRFNQVTQLGEPLNRKIQSQQRIHEDVDLEMPLSYGVGLSLRFSDALTLALDVYRTNWSGYTLEDSKGNRFSPIDGQLKRFSNIEDTTQVRIGGEYLLIPRTGNTVIPLRAGLFYDPEPSEGDVKDFYGFSVGSGIVYKGVIFDMAYQFRWGKDVDTGNLIQGSEADVYQHTFLASLILHF